MGGRRVSGRSYFSQFEPQSHAQIVETATIPAAAAWRFVYRFDRSRHEALGQRIIEGPADGERFELRDPGTAAAYAGSRRPWTRAEMENAVNGGEAEPQPPRR